jgi:hypothetical protein
MKRGKLLPAAALFVVVAVASFVVGRCSAPTETWADRHVNRSKDPQEFRNSFLGLTVRAPKEGEWWLLWQPRPAHDATWEPPEFKMPLDAGIAKALEQEQIYKVVEIERVLDPSGSDKQWARMDVYAAPVLHRGQASQVLRKLELRSARENLQLEAPQETTVSGTPATVRLGGWSVKNKGFRVATYSVEHRHKLFVFSGVTPAEAFERFLPVFHEVVASVRLR